MHSNLEIWEKDKILIQEKKVIERLSLKIVFRNIANAFNIEKGLLHLIWKLSIKPGPIIKSYLDLERHKIFPPLKYFLLVIGISIFTSSITDYDVNEEAMISAIKEYKLLTNEELDELTTDQMSARFKKKLLNDSESDVFKFYSNHITNKLEFKHRNFFSILIIVLISLLSWCIFISSKFNGLNS